MHRRFTPPAVPEIVPLPAGRVSGAVDGCEIAQKRYAEKKKKKSDIFLIKTLDNNTKACYNKSVNTKACYNKRTEAQAMKNYVIICGLNDKNTRKQEITTEQAKTALAGIIISKENAERIANRAKIALNQESIYFAEFASDVRFI